jgi:hypothetical protein
MAEGIDVLHLFPKLAAIGQLRLQDYCNEWLARPLLQKCGLTHIDVSHELLLSLNVNPARADQVGDAMFVPIDQLLSHIVERHFTDPDERRRLYLCIRDTRSRWGELGRNYTITTNRTGRLFLTCKNPACRAELGSSIDGVEGWTVNCPTTEITCPICGVAFRCDGSDLHFGHRISRDGTRVRYTCCLDAIHIHSPRRIRTDSND